MAMARHVTPVTNASSGTVWNNRKGSDETQLIFSSAARDNVRDILPFRPARQAAARPFGRVSAPAPYVSNPGRGFVERGHDRYSCPIPRMSGWRWLLKPAGRRRSGSPYGHAPAAGDAADGFGRAGSYRLGSVASPQRALP